MLSALYKITWPTLFLTDYQAGWNNQKLIKNTHLFCPWFQVSKVFLMEILRYVVLHQLLHQRIWFFTNLLELHSALFEKIFLLLLADSFTPLLHHPFPFDSQNLLSIKAFCWYSFMWEANFLNTSLYGSRIQGRIGINWGIGFKQKKLFWKHLY